MATQPWVQFFRWLYKRFELLSTPKGEKIADQENSRTHLGTLVGTEISQFLPMLPGSDQHVPSRQGHDVEKGHDVLRGKEHKGRRVDLLRVQRWVPFSRERGDGLVRVCYDAKGTGR